MSQLPADIYAQRDRHHARTVDREHARAAAYIGRKRAQLELLQHAERIRQAGPLQSVAVFGPGYSGLGGNRATDGKPRILYPKERKRPRAHLREIYLSRKQYRQAAKEEEVLVPVRLDFDSEKYKLRDTFTWNLNDHTIPVDLFADHLCEDYNLPQSAFVDNIKRSIAEQLNEFHPHKFPEASEPGDTTGVYTDQRDDDLRIPVKLDITIGRLNLIDQFEWDINAEHNLPEQFARSMCHELGLAQEFQTAIAHAIREQCQLYTKSLFLVGHTFDGSAVADSGMRQALMTPLADDIHRPKHLLDDFGPILSELLPDQLERVEKEREREGRRNRRQTRTKRGPNLPDLNDLPKTYRTPYHNSVLIPEDERTADKFGIMREPMPGTFEDANGSDEDDLADDSSTRDTSERFTRSIRQQRGLTSAQSNTSTPMHATSTQRSSTVTKNLHGQAINSPLMASAHRHHAETLRQTPSRYAVSTSRSLYADDASRPSSPPAPSLLVKLRVPSLRRFLAQQDQRTSVAQMSGLRGYAQHLQQQQHQYASMLPDGPPELPLWLVKRLQALRDAHPRDRFEPVMHPPSMARDRNDMGVSIRCLHCAGAPLSLSDFDKHLQSRDHRFRVDA